jgi:hypothetical protein
MESDEYRKLVERLRDRYDPVQARRDHLCSEAAEAIEYLLNERARALTVELQAISDLAVALHGETLAELAKELNKCKR